MHMHLHHATLSSTPKGERDMGGSRRKDGGHRANATAAAGTDGEVIIVAVDATKDITDSTLDWAIRNVVQPKDTLILLALLKATSHTGRLQIQAKTATSNANNQSNLNNYVTSFLKKWGLRNDSIKGKHRLSDANSTSRRATSSGNGVDQEEMGRVIEACLEMMNDMCRNYDVKQVRAQVKALPYAQISSVADKAEEYQASWVILDRQLKKESECCSRQLHCNVILIDHDLPKVLQLVPAAATDYDGGEDKEEESRTNDSLPVQSRSSASSKGSTSRISSSSNASNSLGFSSDQDVTAAASEREPAPLKPTLRDYINIVPKRQQQDKGQVPLPPERLHMDNISNLNNHQLSAKHSQRQGGINDSDMKRRMSVDSGTKHNTGMESIIQSEGSFKTTGTGADPTKISGDGAKRDPVMQSRRSVDSATINRKTEMKPSMQPRRYFKESNTGAELRSTIPLPTSTRPTKFDRASSVRQAMSLSIKQPTEPPPLCSVCKYKAPVFGKPPRKFSYKEMERVTNGFSDDNFLAEGGYGPVYKGVLADGQAVAVKKHKKVSAQGAAEFCAEVEVLSCAQHRNLVMLVGYCLEEEEWLLVYEFACNGSLDKHLHKKDEKEAMAWQHRQKVAIGAARGLRYLHEDCRVGCIIHRDLRPNNILLTHDFEPMVGDFGLARRQTDGQTPEETRIVGTLGYVAPEYTQTGQITEKADVYAFGLLLIELISGLKAIDIIRREKLYHVQWATSLMERMRAHELVDPRLNGNYAEREVRYMMHVAYLCVSPDPDLRPRMSQVLRMLEGDMPSDSEFHQQSQTPHSISRSNASNQRSQTPTPFSRFSNNISNQCSLTLPPISRSSDTSSQLRSQTPTPIARSGDNTSDLGSQVTIPITRSTLTAHSSLYCKSFHHPFEQSKFVQKRYGLQNANHDNDNVMKQTPALHSNPE